MISVRSCCAVLPHAWAASWLAAALLVLSGPWGQAVAQEPMYTTRPLSPAPVYLGSHEGGPGCAKQWLTAGREPDVAGPRPLFLYFVGATGDYLNESSVKAVVEAMARRGYASVQVQYDNGWQMQPMQLHNKVSCMFDPNRDDSLVGKLCAQADDIDCSLGIVVWGHSQGAAVAAMAGSYDARVRAAVVTGFGQGFDTRAWTRQLWLVPNRYRLINGAGDLGVAPNAAGVSLVNREITGLSCAGSPCLLLSGGGGWITIPHAEVSDGTADHCWFKQGGNCVAEIDPLWTQSPGPYPHSLESTATWLAREAPAGLPPPRVLRIDFASLPSGLMFQNIYPWGVIDWQPASAFRVRSGAAGPNPPMPENAETRHAVIGESDEPATGEFLLYGPHGRELVALHAYFPGVSSADPSPATVTVRVEHAAVGGEPMPDTTVVASLPPRAWTEIRVGAVRARKVYVTSDRGNLVRFDSVIVAGTAPAPVR